MSKAKAAVKPGRTKTFTGTLPRGIKASQAVSSVAGVTLRTDGQLRWEARIRRSLDGQALKFPLVRYPVDPKAPPNTEHHIDAARLMAEAYVRREHASLELRQTPYAHTAEAWTFGDLLRRFVQEIDDGLIKHASVRTDHSNAYLFLGGGNGLGLSHTGMPHLTRKLAKDLTQDDFLGRHASSFVNSYIKVKRDGTTLPMAQGSKKRALTTIRNLFRIAHETWQIDLRSPIKSLKSLNSDDSRDRTLTEEEWNAIVAQLDAGRTDPATADVIRFARMTAARRSECVKLDWADINFKKKTARLRETKAKNGKYNERVIPLTSEPMALIAARFEASEKKKGAVFVSSRGKRIRADTVTQAWDRVRGQVAEKLGDPDILTARMHDLRHTRITEMGHHLNPAEAARISGHKDLKTFMRYFNPDPVALGRKLEQLERQGGAGKDVDEVVKQLLTLSPENMASAVALAFQARAKAP
ncbi:site-specific integrase [Xanthomonas vesicatoria]|uniref:site-specific integrase n=1 Tax=Xanthomonas vesicatoria TaxID=56460 RepID=UPI001E4DEAAB|nr:site-specific integrase [Xanthomonas vesicatoria]MCC8626482.1 site-specific integrase [Xanthomonas vesicatoria]MDG4481832.1 site-specific integrase [Xanthomonas vesicatoria]